HLLQGRLPVIGAELESVDVGEAKVQQLLPAALQYGGRHAKYRHVEIPQELRERGEHPPVVAVDFIEDDDAVDEEREVAGRSVAVLEESEELIDRRAEEPLGPLPERKETGFVDALLDRNIGVYASQLGIRRSTDERGRRAARMRQ